ncbi:hypothetical protein Tco_0684275 [Tanacetum coccineum]
MPFTGSRGNALYAVKRQHPLRGQQPLIGSEAIPLPKRVKRRRRWQGKGQRLAGSRQRPDTNGVTVGF